MRHFYWGRPCLLKSDQHAYRQCSHAWNRKPLFFLVPSSCRLVFRWMVRTAVAKKDAIGTFLGRFELILGKGLKTNALRMTTFVLSWNCEQQKRTSEIWGMQSTSIPAMKRQISSRDAVIMERSMHAKIIRFASGALKQVVLSFLFRIIPFVHSDACSTSIYGAVFMVLDSLDLLDLYREFSNKCSEETTKVKCHDVDTSRITRSRKERSESESGESGDLNEKESQFTTKTGKEAQNGSKNSVAETDMELNTEKENGNEVNMKSSSHSHTTSHYHPTYRSASGSSSSSSVAPFSFSLPLLVAVFIIALTLVWKNLSSKAKIKNTNNGSSRLDVIQCRFLWSLKHFLLVSFFSN